MAKIGVFDSGMGGLTVLADIRRALLKADLIYIGDSANAPYGTKTQAEIAALSEQIVESLISAGAEAIVIACNTATSAAGEFLRSKYSHLPIVGLEPALKPAVERTKQGKIAVLATDYTLSNKKYLRLKERVANQIEIISIAAPKLVELVEYGVIDGPEIQANLQKLFGSATDINSLVLGCTHFLHLKPALRQFFGPSVEFFDGNDGVVRQLVRLLPNSNSGGGKTTIMSTGNKDTQTKYQETFRRYLEHSSLGLMER